MSRKTLSLAVTSLSFIALLSQSGCNQQCAQVKQDYTQALAQEATLLQDLEFQQGMPTHIGVGLRYKVLSDVAKKLLGKSLDQGLKIKTAVAIGGGKEIKVDLDGDALNLGFEPDPSCEACFRVVGDLGGKASVDIPLLGKRTVPLDGSLNLIAPVLLEALEDGKVKVKLDLNKIADHAGTFLQLQLEDLPEATSRLLKQPLTKEVFKRLTANLEPVELFTFSPPELGVPNLRVFPSEIKLIPASKAIFVGFTTNLPGVQPGQGLTAAQALQFPENENVAVSVQPSILMPAVTALMQDGKIPRRYTLQGQADPEGPTHITLQNLAIGEKAEAVAGGEPLALAFRAWNMMGGPCFWFDGVIKGLLALENGKLKIDLQAVELTNASTAPELVKALSNWKTSEFADSTKTMIERSLTSPSIEIPGGKLILSPNSIAKDARTLTLRSKVQISLGATK